ncbi:MAG: hypothetical protein ACRELA_02025 [Candidatus Rokuibacteriota bacterium]
MRWVRVIVRHPSGPRYACRRESSGWRCGRCEVGLISAPRIGSLCPVCRAEVVLVQHRLRRVLWALTAIAAGLLLLWALSP